MEVNTDANLQQLNMNNYLSNSLINPSAIILFCLVIISYFVLFFYLDNKTDEYTPETNSGDNILIIIVIAIFIILIIINAFQYFFSINIIASITGLFSETPQLNIVVDQSKYTHSVVPEIKLQKQVFNIPGNNYDYENAKALCQAYGSNLATYEQVEQAYNNGAEWCNYGWSKGQMGLFPTQQKTYNNLQKISGHENDCGRPGINGGFIANPNIKFGVNCYGYKPRMTPEEETLMSSTTPYPQTKKDIQFQEQVDYWKTKISEILVSPFNYNNWSRI
jgi:amino acid transporter